MALVALLHGCAAVREQVKAPEVSVSDVRIVGMSLTEAQIAVEVAVTNPNGFAIPLDGLTYGMAIQDKPLFTGALDQKSTVEPRQSARVTLPFALRFADLGGVLGALRESKALRYELSGKIDLGLLKLPYAKAGSVQMPKLPEFSVQGVQLSRVTLTGAELLVKIKVANVNGFPLALDGLNYDLKLADAAVAHGDVAHPVAVAAHSDGVVSVKLAVSYAQGGKILEGLRSGKTLPVEFNARVTAPGGDGAEFAQQWKGEVPVLRN